jgi:hypothetical protein
MIRISSVPAELVFLNRRNIDVLEVAVLRLFVGRSCVQVTQGDRSAHGHSGTCEAQLKQRKKKWLKYLSFKLILQLFLIVTDRKRYREKIYKD